MSAIGRLSHVTDIAFHNTFVLFRRRDEQFTLRVMCEFDSVGQRPRHRIFFLSHECWDVVCSFQLGYLG